MTWKNKCKKAVYIVSARVHYEKFWHNVPRALHTAPAAQASLCLEDSAETVTVTQK